jgi:putative endonuclease
MEDNRSIGTQNEELAEKYLAGKGYTVVHRNFHFGREGEIDLICKDGSVLVFVEVKARKTHEYGLPEDSITMTKRKTIRRTAEGYLYVNKIEDTECRFDVVAIDYVTGDPEIRHWVNAFS